jgi:phytoene synthase
LIFVSAGGVDGLALTVKLGLQFFGKITLTPLPEHMMDSAEQRADLAACRQKLRHGSRSFHAASMLLPRQVRDSATALYAFCRLADDAIDDTANIGDARARALADLRIRLDAAYTGRPHDDPADRAFAHIIALHHIPRAVPDALLEGFAWDLQNRRYETLAELHDYAARVAGTVGVMMAMVMGVRAPAALARACDLGIAMQLTNIARDVGEDARAGRLYLPLSWLHGTGIDPETFVARPEFTPSLGALVQRLLASADFLYVRGGGGIATLPFACRPGIDAARRLYAGIGRQVERAGGDSVSRRARVSAPRKLSCIIRSVGAIVREADSRACQPLAAAQFLVSAAASAPLPRHRPAPANLDDRFASLFGLLERLQAHHDFGGVRP